MQSPILPILALLPLAAAILLLFLPAAKRNLIRGIALGTSIVTLILSVIVFFAYDTTVAGYQFDFKFDWLPALGIGFHMGVDGIGAAMELMAGLVVFSGVMVSWNIEDRPREFFSFLLFLASSVFGVFGSLDLFQLFIFFELAVFPKYLMIVMWGYPKTKEYGGMKLTLTCSLVQWLRWWVCSRCISHPGCTRLIWLPLRKPVLGSSSSAFGSPLSSSVLVC